MDKIPVRHISTFQKEPDISERFSIRDLHDLLAGKDMVQELHRHDFFYVLALKKGAGSHDIDFISYTVGDNSVFFMRPGQVHQLVLKAGSTGYLLQFREEFYFPREKVSNQLLRQAGNINHYELNADAFQKLLNTLTSIFNEYTGKQERYEDVIRANMGILFIELVRQHSRATPDNVTLYTQERLEAFLSLLETHVNKKQVAEYAAMLNLSTYQLNAITKAALGKTCSELINEHIILEAKRYLLATSNQINQIAYYLGYEDVSYFIRFFKKHMGHSPEAFRHNFK
ncbi:helix-turn-helix domain-containing protein [Mucilaginibacter sp.]|uniref:AraC family transcriptional regulator n=1 Tax=Mucilaginibacter sp. TaxID=1882438 RepID=UPI0025DB1BF9|nr:helix-turn-helix domain-containing protein [Mucilaginibacter sp.]